MRAAMLTCCWALLALGAGRPAFGQVCNIKVVTDANPDYHDIGSMIHSITGNWPEAKDKCWAMFYWNHIARRQTTPMILHGHELTDPIRQFNDYGYTMCSTVSGINCGIWGAMGLNVRFWDISLHTVPEVEYDGRYHMYDNSMSAIYTLCDGKTVAGVTDSLTIHASFFRKTDQDANSLAISTTNGLTWRQVWTNDRLGETPAEIKLIDEVNGACDVLVKGQLLGKTAPADARLRSIRFQTITMLNSKTQPSLRLGRNTVYVALGEQTESIVVWPDLRGDSYKPYVVEEHNVAAASEHPGYQGVMHAEKADEDAYVVFRIDAPGDISGITYGGRFYNRTPGSHMDLLHSFDGGRSWAKDWSLADTTPPWDVIHYETVKDVPSGARSVLFKYLWNGPAAGNDACSLFAVRMEADYRPADATFRPIEVTFAWRERQEDYSTVARSHTQLVEDPKGPFTYTINVGGADHPVVDSLRVNLKGAAGDLKYGYSDGRDPVAASQLVVKFRDRWVTYGRNLAVGKPYTCSPPSESNWGAGDADGRTLTDGVVGPSCSGGAAYRWGALWKRGQTPVITVDLGRAEKCGAFRIHVGGYPFWDALRGQVKDKVELLTSLDGKQCVSQGFINFDLRWKDLPVNFMWPDDEVLTACSFERIVPRPVDARYVRFKLGPQRFMSVTEVQVFDSIRYEPFDLKIALPDGKDRSDIARFNPRHTPSTAYRAGNAKGGSP